MGQIFELLFVGFTAVPGFVICHGSWHLSPTGTGGHVYLKKKGAEVTVTEEMSIPHL